MSSYESINKMFEAEAAKNGGIVRRKITDIEKNASLRSLIKEVQERRFHLIETEDQYVVICNSGKFKVHC